MFIIATANKEFQLTAGKFVPVSNFTTKNVCVLRMYVQMYVRMYVYMYVRAFVCMYVFIRSKHPREHKLHTIGFFLKRLQQ